MIKKTLSIQRQINSISMVQQTLKINKTKPSKKPKIRKMEITIKGFSCEI